MNCPNEKHKPRDNQFGITWCVKCGRYQFLEDKIQVSPFFSIGTNNCQDVGIRVGYKVFNGIYVGAIGSRLMKYGLSISVSVNKQD